MTDAEIVRPPPKHIHLELHTCHLCEKCRKRLARWACSKLGQALCGICARGCDDKLICARGRG